jgi:quercetin dioxygenase-like cupin family protein
VVNIVNAFPDFICKLPAVDIPIEGVSGSLFQGQTMQAVFLEFEKDAEVPEHSHAAQWELVLDGEVELRMDGKTVAHRAGSQFYIPAGVAHGAKVSAGYRAIVFFDQVDRYKAK